MFLLYYIRSSPKTNKNHTEQQWNKTDVSDVFCDI